MKRARRVDVGGLNVAYLDCGPPESHDVIFLLHDGAYGTTAELAWNDVIPILSQTYRVVAPDLIGYGDSTKVAFFEQTPHAVNIALIGELCGILGLNARRVHFVGTSFGGGLVLNAAGRKTPAWSMATGTTIGGTFGYARRKDVFGELRYYDQTISDARRITQLLVADDPDSLPGHVEQRYTNGLIPGHWETLNAPHLSAPASDSQSSPTRGSAIDFLRDCAVPLLFIEGRDDRLLTPGWARRMASATPNGTPVEIAGAHCPNIDYPLHVAKQVLEFVAEDISSGPQSSRS